MAVIDIDKSLSARGYFANEYDVIVIGATEAGCMAARIAADQGMRVLLTSDSERVGWMTGWGINNQDVVPGHTPAVMGGRTWDWHEGLARHNTNEKSLARWWSLGGRMRPSWVQRAFAELLGHPNIRILTNARIKAIGKTGTVIQSVTFDQGTFSAPVFVDGTEAGDVVQCAGLSYSVGREATALYGEASAGAVAAGQWDNNITVDPYVTPGNAASGLLPGIDAQPLAAVGSGDGRPMGVTYRLFITSDAGDKQAFPAPANTGPYAYNAANYELLGRAMAADPAYYGHASLGLGRVLTLYDIGLNGGTAMGPTYLSYADVNNAGAMSTNYLDPDGIRAYITNKVGGAPDYAYRAGYQERVRQHVLGLLYWLKTDARVPAALKTALAAYGLSNKELGAYGGFSPQLYLREGARCVGDFVMDQNDANLNNGFEDTIGWLFYDEDSHFVRRVVSGGKVVPEGAVLTALGTNYGSPIPMRICLPKAAECTNLVLAYPVSVSQVIWRSIRVGPSMMMVGAAAGAIAAEARRAGTSVQSVSRQRVQALIDHKRTNDGIVLGTTGLIYAQGTVTKTGTWSNGISRFGGLEPVAGQPQDSYATTAGATGATIKFAPNIWEAGLYEVLMAYATDDEVANGGQGRATNLVAKIGQAAGEITLPPINQLYSTTAANGRCEGGRWLSLGTFYFRQGQPSADYLLIDDAGANGRVSVAGAKFRKIR